MTYLWLVPFIIGVVFIGMTVRDFFRQRLEGVVDVVLACIFLITAFLCALIEYFVNMGVAAIFLIALCLLGWFRK